MADARLVLEDGSIWRAKSFGASGTQVGEVVFNTSLTGLDDYEIFSVTTLIIINKKKYNFELSNTIVFKRLLPCLK